MSVDHFPALCAEKFRIRWASLGADVLVTDTTPKVLSPWTVDLRCPHGVTYWIEPTHEQATEWALRDGAR